MFRWQGNNIVSALGGHLVLDVYGGKGEDGAQICIYDKNNGQNQSFHFENVPMLGHIATRLNNKVMDVYGGHGNQGDQVVIYERNHPPSKNQLFYMQEIRDGWFHIVPECNRNCVLDVRNSNSSAGAEICIWSRNSPTSKNQMFRWNGETIVSALDQNLALDIYGGHGNNGDKIVIYDRHSEDNQRWFLDRP